MRILITSILGILIILGAVIVARNLAATKNTPKAVERKVITPVSVSQVKNVSTPVILTTSGNLIAKNMVEIYAEVTGIFEHSDHVFKPGTRFEKGATLISINSDEHQSNLRSQKSTLSNQIALFLPDLKLDYPEAFPKWEKYIRSFKIDEPLLPLPETGSEKERLFILGKGIYSTFYNIDNLEKRLAKYNILAPFTGVLTEVGVNPGALVRNGQKLADFISTRIYELEVNINASYLELLKVGKTVALQNLENTKSWQGRVARVNGRVDQASQTIKVFIDVSGSGLKEGMYLKADLNVKNIENTFELDRKLLFDENKLFIVRDTLLEEVIVNPLFFKEESVIVEGLTDGVYIMSRPVPGAHHGMRVKIINF